MKKVKSKMYIRNILFPAFILSGITGILSGILIYFFRISVSYITGASSDIYEYIKGHLLFVPLLFFMLVLIAYIVYRLLRIVPTARGGGIPTSEGILRGLLKFEWAKTLIFVMFSSYLSFLTSVPLGTTGPSVQLGTAVGDGVHKCFNKKNKAWNRYIMTGGAASSFAVAIGAPLTGIIFALEEVHRKFSPMILLVALSSVVSATITAEVLCGITGYDFMLFNFPKIVRLPLFDLWTVVLFGFLIGISSLLFGKLIKFASKNFDKKLTLFVKLVIVFVSTGILGLLFIDAVGGGRALVEDIFNGKFVWYILLILLVVKMIIIAFASQSGATGGLFMPLLAIGALLGGLFGQIVSPIIGNEFYTMFVVVGMCAFMGAAIGSPITALVFSVEALGNINNIVPTIVCISIAFLVTKLLNIDSAFDIVLDKTLDRTYSHRHFDIIETSYTISEDSFVVGKPTRDLLLPPNSVILNIKRVGKPYSKMDNDGDKFLYEGDIITMMSQSYNIDDTIADLEDFFGKDSFDISKGVCEVDNK